MHKIKHYKPLKRKTWLNKVSKQRRERMSAKCYQPPKREVMQPTWKS
ncbi:hypothetical protein [Mycoplasmoides pneumoniae]|uniref:Uncharacterized protein n=1 Tax=Mycoplasmoides pneumoniae TaxID=2104 RepID=A0AB38W9U9_MYCPM|nr:hypothetical protein [Mycoplasmoides pneumoniae]GLL60835.1 hypothetical protein OA571N_7220 [Mycoplasmoides pneumoniae]VEU57353.1 Uncharacterised protein [Mycoplasmoides pneumoniae]